MHEQKASESMLHEREAAGGSHGSFSTITVMSSRRAPCSTLHMSLARSTMAQHISCAVPLCTDAMESTTSFVLSMSHTPSVAITIAKSSSARVYLRNTHAHVNSESKLPEVSREHGEESRG